LRKGLIIQLIVLGVIVGAVAIVVSFWIPWLPDLGSEQGGRIDDVYTLISVICLCIFAIVAAVTIYAVVKFRVKDEDDDEDGKPIHGHTGVEVFWTAIPTALVTVIAIYSGIVLTKNEELPANHRVIEVTAQQFTWSFTYPENGYTTGVLRVPVDETIELKMQALDVIHSFWVPQWRVKQDIVPGNPQRYIVTPTKLGTFPVICTELCGLGHSTMRAKVIVMAKAEFEQWLAEQKPANGTPPDGETGGATTGAATASESESGS
jgi:cytochrome c oxidase subunit II